VGKRQKAWAREARRRLIETLGGVCAECGTTEKLELDCIIPQGDDHHKFDQSARMCFYNAQHRAGNLQVLCDKHNNLKSLKEKPEQPF
jgi:5-methylcytosine-specific restriction endonuclease McrA